MRGVPTAVLVAPDSFKGSFTASEVCEALARGLACGGVDVDRCPLGDGGEGTLDALAGPLGLELVAVRASDPLRRPLEAEIGLARGPHGGVAVVELARASGLATIEEGDRDAVRADTYGTGQLILAAVAAGVQRVLVCAGGSASSDGGAGAVEALLEGGGVGDARLTVLCDVRTPWEDAAPMFAPQKGASAREVTRLAKRLDERARSMARDPRGVPMTGAAGGFAGGLWSEFGAELVAGAGYVLELVGFDARMRGSRAVLTGEGRIDTQTLAGKLVGEIATRARQAGAPCHAVAGSCLLGTFELRMLDLDGVREAGTLAELEAAGGELAERILHESGRARAQRSG